MPGYCSLLLVALASSCEAFALARPALHVSTVAPRVSTPATMQLFGKRKTSEEILEEKGYWPGEWVCADCGYIYEPGTTRHQHSRAPATAPLGFLFRTAASNLMCYISVALLS